MAVIFLYSTNALIHTKMNIDYLQNLLLIEQCSFVGQGHCLIKMVTKILRTKYWFSMNRKLGVHRFNCARKITHYAKFYFAILLLGVIISKAYVNYNNKSIRDQDHQ